MRVSRFAAVLAVATFATTAQAQAQKSPGEQLFGQRCKICHSVEASGPALLGPNLRGVVGRKAGSTTFRYSPALKASNIGWTKETLDKFLSGPTKMVPGTRMVVSLPDAKQRADLLAYLATLR
ncbi:c-type cytochrome [Sphingobium sufflavum]|uniref:c-type cytochrome n=1 Tax=Sphingobium sufflavum TaxID=1129547 RepID=UPI001F4022D2|nr:c-type cytochrome [Sphingobium sufflavum]MCE7796324.1 c-type cytochrome [Sphingobium sufflavum]